MDRPAPARTGTTIRIRIGMGAIELSLFARTADYKVERNEFRTVIENGVEVDHPVGRKAIDTVTEEEIAFKEITRKVVTENGYTYLSDEELERFIEGRIVSVQPMHTWATGQYIPKGSFIVEPKATTVKKKKVVDPLAAKVLAALLAVLAEKKAVAVLEYMSRGNPHAAVLLPTGVLWEVCYAEEMRQARIPWAKPEVTEADLAQVRDFVSDHWSAEAVIPENTAVTKIKELAEARAASTNTPVTQVPISESVDLSDLFKASIDTARRRAS